MHTKINYKSPNFSDLFLNLQDWEFYRHDGKVASKNKIIHEIKDIKCYIIEDAFNNMLESSWKIKYNIFFNEIKCQLYNNQDNIFISYKTLNDIIKFALLSMQRNPIFDFFGFYKATDFNYKFVADHIFGVSFEQSKEFIDNIKKSIHLHQLYERLFSVSKESLKHKSIYEKIDNNIKSGFKIVIYSTKESSFITSDNCSFFNLNNILAHNLNMFIFPMSSAFLLTICKTSEKTDINQIECKGLSNDEVKIFNRIIYSNAHQSIVSNEKYLSANVW